MLRLYTNKSSFKDVVVLDDNDAVFDTHTSKMDFTVDEHALLMKYDGARITGKNELHGWTIDTRYGGGYITNLSTGLKTLLNLRHMKAMPQYAAIDITEAGENVLLDIFEQAAKLDIPLVLRHAEVPKFNGLQILVDNSEVVSDASRLKQLIWTKGDSA